MFRIGIDGRPFQGNPAGTGRYGQELCRVLSEEFPEAQFFVYSNKPITMPVVDLRWTHRQDHSKLWSQLPASLWYLERVATLARHDKLDLFWGGANFLPRGLQGHCRSIVTVLDVVPVLFPETMSWRHRLVHRAYFDRTLKEADRLVTISKGSAYRIEQTYGRRPDEIIYPSASEVFVPPAATDVARVKKLYGVERPFLLAVATLEPRKNLSVLLQALLVLKANGLVVSDLCLVGQVGWKQGSLQKMINQAALGGIRIIQTGFVPNEDLPALYAASHAFVFASVYEGFGMPVLEAVRCGARVLATDLPEIREAGGSQVTYFEPTVDGIADALRAVFAEDCAFEKSLPNANHDQGHDYSWQTEGRKLAMTMKSLL